MQYGDQSRGKADAQAHWLFTFFTILPPRVKKTWMVNPNLAQTEIPRSPTLWDGRERPSRAPSTGLLPAGCRAAAREVKHDILLRPQTPFELVKPSQVAEDRPLGPVLASGESARPGGGRPPPSP